MTRERATFIQFGVGTLGFVCCEGGGDGRRSLDDAPVTIQRGFGHPGVRMLQVHLRRIYNPLPHMLDCCTDSTGAGGPARLLHVGWLYCVKAA